MSEFITVARPYAKAAFDFAVEHQSVERWQDMLAFAAEVTKNEQMAELLSGALAPETLAESFIAVCGEQLDENGQNLIRVMAEGLETELTEKTARDVADFIIERLKCK